MFGEHRKDIGEGLDEGDVEVIGDFRNPLLKILLEEILEFTSKFNTSGTSTNDDHVEKALSFFRRLVFEASCLNAVHDALADLLSIADFFQEAGTLGC